MHAIYVMYVVCFLHVYMLCINKEGDKFTLSNVCLKQLPLQISSVWSQFMCSELLPRCGKWILNHL